MSDSYLPTHDHFYGAFAETPERFFEIFLDRTNVKKSLEFVSNPNYTLNKLSDEYKLLDYSFETGSKSKGVWDIVAKGVTFYECWNGIQEKNQECSKRFSFCIEYKTSLEESNIDQLLRQIQNRKYPDYIYDYDSIKFEPITIIVTFDDRFEKYRPVIENEPISLVILDDEIRKEIKDQFQITKSEKQNDSLSSF